MNKLTNTILPLSVGILGVLILNSCSAGIPKGATAVQNFNADKYLGKWYEIARLDYRFEKNLNNVTAQYSTKDNGHIKVDNQGYDYVKNKQKQSIGEARFRGSENVGELKISYFKPIWAGYNVIDIDEDYKYALVAGDSLKNLWILSRQNTIPEDIKQRFLQKAESIGYNTEDLVWVKHK